MNSFDYEGNMRINSWEAMYNNVSQLFKTLEYDFNGGHLSIALVFSANNITYPARFHYNLCDYQGNVRLVLEALISTSQYKRKE